ncbi:MAG: hypothetical protein QOE41_2737 [Mycobacterium sp.]|nr:hypothetical protein [Mycobacterium sp.]
MGRSLWSVKDAYGPRRFVLATAEASRFIGDRAGSDVNSAVRGRRSASPVRLTLASSLGGDIDGAWWPHTTSVARELPELIAALHRILGEIIDISVNWSPSEGPPDLNSHGWQNKRPHLMTVAGTDARVNLLVIPHLTSNALALMVLRKAAGLTIDKAQHESAAFYAAESIVRGARAESALCANRLASAQPPTVH